MSSEVVNDENQGALPVHKHFSSESAADIFALDQPTGRPSILRQSQAENLNKNIPKGVKVCFQTPLRDPVTKKIMSPSRVGRMATLDDCTNALESLTLKSPTPHSAPMLPIHIPAKTDTSLPDDDMPIQSRGGYAIDFDNLESVNPFQSSGKMILSPPKPAALLSDTLILSEPAPPASSPASDQVEKVTEKIDMGLDETLPFIPSVENSLADFSADGASTDSTVIIEPRKTPPADHSSDETMNVKLSEPAPVVLEDVTDSLSLPKGSYQIDFANLDSVNPFNTGGAKIQNSPPISRKSPVCDLVLSQAEDVSSRENIIEMPVVQEEKLSTTVQLSPPEVAADTAAPLVTPPKDAPMVLEFNFDDDAGVKRKPPPKRLGLKKPPLSKTKPDGTKPSSVPPTEKKSPEIKAKACETKPVSVPPAEKKSPEIKARACDAETDSTPTDIPPARGAYSIDFAKFDDPNFNPFGTAVKMGSSPPRSAPGLSEVSTGPVLLENQESAVENPTHSFDSTEPGNATGPELSSAETAEEQEPLLVPEAHQPSVPVISKPLQVEEPAFLHVPTQSTEFDMTTADDEFVPGSMFMPSDLDGQIDYLEQFGSNTFKESALRKQSLYLKFDPLLKESPKKAAAESSGFSLPRPSLAIRMMEAARSEVRQKSNQECPKLLEDFPAPVEPPAVQDPIVVDLLVPTLKQTQRSDDVIVDMLKYTQKDLDTALEKAQKQAEEREAELKAQIEKMTLDNQHMVLIVSEFEAVIAQITAEHKQKEELAQAELSKVLEEKQQLAKDLSDMERSFSDVVKRLDRRKEVIDGFKKNEETLKQCAQSYLARLQKEEQRYQMLKTHAEEKIDQANKHIAEVRTKMGAEVSALQVQLKREQLKVQSLEKNLEQKTKEVEDVTKLCDELIAKVQHH